MKHKTVLLLSILLLISCRQDEKSQCLPILQKTFENLEIEGRFDFFISQYIQEHPEDQDFHLYTYSDSFDFTAQIMKHTVDAMQREPLLTIKYRERNIFLYTGLEEYLKPNDISNVMAKNEMDTIQTENSVWTIIFDRERSSRDKIYLFKNRGLEVDTLNMFLKHYNSNDIFSSEFCHLEIDSRLDSLLSCYIQELNDELGNDIYNYMHTIYLSHLSPNYPSRLSPNYSTSNFIISQTYQENDLFYRPRNSPLFYMDFRGIRFYILTGLEFVIWSDCKNANLPLELPKKGIRGRTWSCDFTPNKVRVYKSNTIYQEGDWNWNDNYDIWEDIPQTWIDYPSNEAMTNDAN